MYFQIIDNNKKCLKVYARGDYMDYESLKGFNRTWKHSAHLTEREDVDYAYLYTSDGEIDSLCPMFVLDSWKLKCPKGIRNFFCSFWVAFPETGSSFPESVGHFRKWGCDFRKMKKISSFFPKDTEKVRKCLSAFPENPLLNKNL